MGIPDVKYDYRIICQRCGDTGSHENEHLPLNKYDVIKCPKCGIVKHLDIQIYGKYMPNDIDENLSEYKGYIE